MITPISLYFFSGVLSSSEALRKSERNNCALSSNNYLSILFLR